MYKLISLDMDKTTLRSDHKLSDRNKKALKKAHDLGIKVIINTGRTYSESVQFLEEMDFVDYAGFGNGTVVFEKATGDLHKLNGIDLELLKITNNISKKYLGDVVVFAADEREVFSDKIYEETPSAKAHFDLVKVKVSYLDNFIEFFEDKFLSKAVVFGKNETLQLIKVELDKALGDRAQVIFSVECALEILAPNSDKSNGMHFIAEECGIDKNKIIAFGDGENDIGMIKAAKLGVAMANACEGLKEVADYITLSNDEDGVAVALEKFVLV